MPFIDVRLSKKITDEKKEQLKSELGKSIKIMRKPESFLMVGICDGYDLYFAGNKLENGAFVAVNVLGEVDPPDSLLMTRRISEILDRLFSVKSSDIYVTYAGFDNWGWNGDNF